MLKIHPTASFGPEDQGFASTLDELAREGARRMLLAALEGEDATLVRRRETFDDLVAAEVGI